LGVVFGSAGLGLVTARNLSERRDEFAILQAVGVPAGVTRRVVMLEAGQFIRWGLGIGGGAAVVSILPALAADGIGKSLLWIALLVLLIAANAWAWSWLVLRRQCRVAPGRWGQ
jgi:ABC-type antimicrobial peptide transport system permease subunit